MDIEDFFGEYTSQLDDKYGCVCPHTTFTTAGDNCVLNVNLEDLKKTGPFRYVRYRMKDLNDLASTLPVESALPTLWDQAPPHHLLHSPQTLIYTTTKGFSHLQPAEDSLTQAAGETYVQNINPYPIYGTCSTSNARSLPHPPRPNRHNVGMRNNWISSSRRWSVREVFDAEGD